ncbi:hypothetical protein [Kitasatospora sp. NPDC059803]|uniref:hypothetical protein n=1 Tax=Kitasatospora sp. NPDC059803 TaxID=3346953 RepID=UPI003659EE05
MTESRDAPGLRHEISCTCHEQRLLFLRHLSTGALLAISEADEQCEGRLSFFDVRGLVSCPLCMDVDSIATCEFGFARLIAHEIDHLDFCCRERALSKPTASSAELLDAVLFASWNVSSIAIADVGIKRRGEPPKPGMSSEVGSPRQGDPVCSRPGAVTATEKRLRWSLALSHT